MIKMMLACDGVLPRAAEALISHFKSQVEVVSTAKVTPDSVRIYDCIVIVSDMLAVAIARPNMKKWNNCVVAITDNTQLEFATAYRSGASAVFDFSQGAELCRFVEGRESPFPTSSSGNSIRSRRDL